MLSCCLHQITVYHINYSLNQVMLADPYCRETELSPEFPVLTRNVFGVVLLQCVALLFHGLTCCAFRDACLRSLVGVAFLSA